MRKWIALLLMALLLLTGCGRKGKPLFEPVYFYYPRTEYDYGSADSVITWEAMDGTGHMEDWAYLMGEYFSGPIDEALENPFPRGRSSCPLDWRGRPSAWSCPGKPWRCRSMNFPWAAPA